ncbi:MAG: adenylosuccinate synthase protein [Caulobacter sp.]|jgi:adenylosuccinate synthase|nr:adenylosuccinate synthase protein [Caulobacter sp.]
MAQAYAIIGAGYGDEGKGLMVDALAARTPGAVVARFNGGAQAGHTVARPDGRRHVFHHLGAGALAGAATHLSRFFVHHPMLLRDEQAALAELGANTTVTADPRGPVTTPWDMLINQAVERSRGDGRHGSCGLGFGETLERSLNPAFALTVGDLAAGDLSARLAAIRDAWLPRRLAALGVALTPEEAAVRDNPVILEAFLDDCRHFAATVTQASDAGLAAHDAVIFEGAQGLMLDQVIGDFPHVTRSHTGLANVLAIAREAGLGPIQATYVTRAYATRHGAGPLPGGGDTLPGFEIRDPTNAPNPWQGRMRYAPLDVDRLARAIAADQALSKPAEGEVALSLAVTCLDQAIGPIELGGRAQDYIPANSLAPALSDWLDLPLAAQSWGPRREDVRFAQPALDSLSAA